jgi:hypothetical protein
MLGLPVVEFFRLEREIGRDTVELGDAIAQVGLALDELRLVGIEFGGMRANKILEGRSIALERFAILASLA